MKRWFIKGGDRWCEWSLVNLWWNQNEEEEETVTTYVREREWERELTFESLFFMNLVYSNVSGISKIILLQYTISDIMLSTILILTNDTKIISFKIR